MAISNDVYAAGKAALAAVVARDEQFIPSFIRNQFPQDKLDAFNDQGSRAVIDAIWAQVVAAQQVKLSISL